MKYRNLRTAKGFTLIEILVVIAILAALSATAWVVFDSVTDKQDKSTAEMQIGKLAACMTEFMSNAEMHDKVLYGEGDENSAFALYKMLNSDFNGDGESDSVKGVALPIACKELTYYDQGSGEKPEGLLYSKNEAGQFVILDPWGRGYRYRLGYGRKGVRSSAASKGGKVKRAKDADKPRKGPGVNVDFDIFTLGPDGLGDGLSKKGENEDNVSNIKFLKG